MKQDNSVVTVIISDPHFEDDEELTFSTNCPDLVKHILTCNLFVPKEDETCDQTFRMDDPISHICDEIDGILSDYCITEGQHSKVERKLQENLEAKYEKRNISFSDIVDVLHAIVSAFSSKNYVKPIESKRIIKTNSFGLQLRKRRFYSQNR